MFEGISMRMVKTFELYLKSKRKPAWHG